MDALSELLKRIPIPGLKESNERHILAQVISDTVNVKISPHQIRFKEGAITLNVQPVLKSAIHMRKDELIEAIQGRGIKIQQIK